MKKETRPCHEGRLTQYNVVSLARRASVQERENQSPSLVVVNLLRTPHISTKVKKQRAASLPWSRSGTVAVQEEVLSPCRTGAQAEEEENASS